MLRTVEVGEGEAVAVEVDLAPGTTVAGVVVDRCASVTLTPALPDGRPREAALSFERAAAVVHGGGSVRLAPGVPVRVDGIEPGPNALRLAAEGLAIRVLAVAADGGDDAAAVAIAETDARGRFRLRVPAGSWRIEARRRDDDLLLGAAAVDVVEGGAVEAEITLR